jgi:PBSX family phage terminase large subunit
MPLIDGKIVDYEMPPKHARVLLDTSKEWMYRVLYGGRSGAKDWTMAAVIIEMMLRKKLRILYTREVKLTIKNSAYQLIVDTINRLGYSNYFEANERRVTCTRNGSFITFMGLKDLNVNNVKSIEGMNICVICEAEDLSKESFKILDPTIREDGGEIWIQFNPQFEDDFVYEFCVTNPPEEMIADKVTYLDHPWNSKRTLKQAERAKKNDPDEYNHTWLGECRGSGGRFYPGIDREVHFKPHECNEQLYNFNYLSRYAQLFMAIDPHTVYYPACIWVARILLGKEYFYVIYNEFPTLSFFNDVYFHKVRKEKECKLTMNDFATMFRIMDCTVGNIQTTAKVIERYVDTRFAKASGAASWSTNTEGLITEWSKPENGRIKLKQPEERIIDVQKDIIREAIKVNEDIPTCSINQSRLLVYPHCHNVKDMLLNHRNNRDNTGEDEKRKDFSDALRICFAGMSKCRWIDPTIPDEKPHFESKRKGVNLCYNLE